MKIKNFLFWALVFLLNLSIISSLSLDATYSSNSDVNAMVVVFLGISLVITGIFFLISKICSFFRKKLSKNDSTDQTKESDGSFLKGLSIAALIFLGVCILDFFIAFAGSLITSTIILCAPPFAALFMSVPFLLFNTIYFRSVRQHKKTREGVLFAYFLIILFFILVFVIPLKTPNRQDICSIPQINNLSMQDAASCEQIKVIGENSSMMSSLCFSQLAQKSDDVLLCGKINPYDSHSREEKINCYFYVIRDFFVKKENFAQYCMKVSESSYKSDCFTFATGLETKNVSVCDSLKNVEGVETCKTLIQYNTKK